MLISFEDTIQSEKTISTDCKQSVTEWSQYCVCANTLATKQPFQTSFSE